MKVNELLTQKDGVMLKDKYNIGFFCTAKEARTILIKEQLLGGNVEEWAERFEVQNES